jgi:hypothetical protein
MGELDLPLADTLGGLPGACERFGCTDSTERSGLPSSIFEFVGTSFPSVC